MKSSGNVLECIYEQVEALYGTTYSHEFLTMIAKGPKISELQPELEENNLQVQVELDHLTNHLCTPFQYVQEVMPISLSSRYLYIVSTWIPNRQVLYEKHHQWLYKNKEDYLMYLRTQIQNYKENQLHEEERDYRKEAKELLSLSEEMLSCIAQSKHVAFTLGEDILEEAKQVLQDSRLSIPKYKSFYPTECIPKDWMSSLKTSFQPIQLSPSLSICMKEVLRIANILENELKKLVIYQVEDLESITEFQKQRQLYLQELILNTKQCSSHDQQILFHFNIMITKPDRLSASFYQKLNRLLENDMSVSELFDIFNHLQKTRQNYWDAVEVVLSYTYDSIVLQSIVVQARQVFEQWKSIQKELFLAIRKSILKQKQKDTLFPYAIPKGYDRVLCSGDVASLYEMSLTHEIQEKEGMQAFFGNHIPFDIQEEALKKVKMQIGFLVRQVTIQRPWLKEEIFEMSHAFTRLRTQKVSNGQHSLPKIAKRCLLPYYPKRMIIAKDVTIQLDFKDAGIEVMKQIERHVKQGHGFLCFQDETYGDEPMMNKESNILTLRYPKPFLLGYFMQITPKDQSKLIGG